MCPQEGEGTERSELSDQDTWLLDQIIMRYWDAKDAREKKKIELECYKDFKRLNFIPQFVNYLRENDCTNLANEMEHFASVYQKVPHEHEKRLAA